MGFRLHSHECTWEPYFYEAQDWSGTGADSTEWRVSVRALDQVKAEIELCESPAVLDLEELELIDVEAVRFLNASEEERCLGVALFALIMHPRPGVQR